jgi:hypothetical protein
MVKEVPTSRVPMAGFHLAGRLDRASLRPFHEPEKGVEGSAAGNPE